MEIKLPHVPGEYSKHQAKEPFLILRFNAYSSIW